MRSHRPMSHTGHMEEPPTHQSAGGCLCGAVRYQVAGPLRDVINCHCSRCRRAHGHFAAYTATHSEALSVTEARGLRWYVADGRERGFCAECGASLFWRRAGAEHTAIAAGTLDTPAGLRTAAHIFTDSRADYYEITDDLPRYPEGGVACASMRKPLSRTHYALARFRIPGWARKGGDDDLLRARTGRETLGRRP
jgi:hypothetical protein